MRASERQSPIEFWLGPAIRRSGQPTPRGKAPARRQELANKSIIRVHPFAARLTEGRFDAPDLERSSHLRTGHHSRKTLHRYRAEGCTVPPPAQQLHDSHSKQTVFPPSRTNCGLERRRPRLRVCEG